MKWKIACFVGGLIFCLFTYWQLNDLGQYGTKWWQGWVMGYGLVALTSFVTAFRNLPVWVYGAGIAFAAFRGIQRFVAIDWNHPGNILYNENNPAGNETGGLVITALWLSFLWYASRKMSRKSPIA